MPVAILEAKIATDLADNLKVCGWVCVYARACMCFVYVHVHVHVYVHGVVSHCVSSVRVALQIRF